MQRDRISTMDGNQGADCAREAGESPADTAPSSPNHLELAQKLSVEVGSPEILPSVVSPFDNGEGGGGDDVGLSCSVCFERPRMVRNRPCGHSLCCGVCTIRAIDPARQQLHCPTCRAEVLRLEWHGESPARTRMATDGRQLSAGGAITSGVLEFISARAEGSDAELAECSRRVLLVWGCSAAESEPFPPLIAAAEAGDLDGVHARLVAAGGDVNVIDSEGWTALVAAASEGHADVVRRLLDEPAIDVNACNHDRESALMRAVLGGHADIVDALLSHEGIDVNLATRHGKTALIIAASAGHVNVTRALLAHAGIDVNAVDREGDSALLHATSAGHADVARALIAMEELHVDVIGSEGLPALRLATLRQYAEIATALRVRMRERARTQVREERERERRELATARTAAGSASDAGVGALRDPS